MARHEIQMTVPKVDVSRVDVEMEIWEDHVKLGTMLLSRGDLRWQPSSTQRRNARQVTWAQFDAWMRSVG